MKALLNDPALYNNRNHEELVGLSGTYVDDVLRAVTVAFRGLSHKTNKRFEMTEDEHIFCPFAAFMLDQDQNEVLLLHQQKYMKSLSLLSEDVNYYDFASQRMKLVWLSRSRPDFMFEISHSHKSRKIGLTIKRNPSFAKRIE